MVMFVVLVCSSLFWYVLPGFLLSKADNKIYVYKIKNKCFSQAMCTIMRIQRLKVQTLRASPIWI